MIHPLLHFGVAASPRETASFRTCQRKLLHIFENITSKTELSSHVCCQLLKENVSEDEGPPRRKPEAFLCREAPRICAKSADKKRSPQIKVLGRDMTLPVRGHITIQSAFTNNFEAFVLQFSLSDSEGNRFAWVKVNGET